MTRKTNQSFIVLVAVIGVVSNGCAAHRSNVSNKNPVVEQGATERRRVHFDFDKSEIRHQDKSALDDVATKLQRDKKSIAILEGHADQIGDSQYNEVLSENRARAVRVYLRDQGADPRRMTMTSKGEREPLVKGRGRNELQENRRVDVILTLTREEK